ncbi:MAG: hypothetical protein CL401_00650 [Acidiferrobacteraceae bacterium]|nr:hypothetical protein [Acidiferrobacteraceae bacterium]
MVQRVMKVKNTLVKKKLETHLLSGMARAWANAAVLPQTKSVISSFELIVAVPGTLVVVSFLLALFPTQ